MSEYMDFGDVIRGLREGKKFARKGWNGKNMFIFLVEGYTTSKVVVKEYISMMNARGEFVVGWLASQEDMLGKDWVEVK